MTFREITNKNLKYNIRKFASYFWINAFVVCVLFLFGSLLFNDILNEDIVVASMRGMIINATVAMIIFSVIFLIYTGYYFISSRSQEFGVYLTLGMTSKDISRIAFIESSIIFAGATILGIVSALLLSNLFYFILALIIGINDNLFMIKYEMFLFSLGVLVFIFIIQQLATSIFIRRLSIIEIIKFNKSKDQVKESPVVGIVSVILFTLSLVIMFGITTGASWIFSHEWLVNIIVYYGIGIMLGTMITLLVSLFFMIGSGMLGIATICKLFPKLYQPNILLFSGLSYKFRAYRTSLFSITVLVGFSIFFIGMGMSLYTSARITLDVFQPHDFMIDSRNGMNHISEEELQEIVGDSGGKIYSIVTMLYLDVMVYQTVSGIGQFSPLGPGYIVSASNFSNFVGQEISVNKSELIIATNSLIPQYQYFSVDIDTILVIEAFENAFERAGNIEQFPMNKDELMLTLSGSHILQFAMENTQMIHIPSVNSRGSLEFMRSHFYVIHDEVFDLIEETPNSFTAFDLADGDHSKIMDALISTLVEKNDLPEDVWNEVYNIDDRLRPISRSERFEMTLRANGLFLFTVGLLGLLFLSSSFLVLYHKFVVDIDEETNRVSQLKKIGLTTKECRRYIYSHLGIVFFLPLFLGGLPGLFLVSRMAVYQVLPSAQMWYHFSYILIMYGIIILFDILLYLALCKRFFKNMNLF